MKEPLVTVYITNHNYGHYLSRAIESVLSQTLESFELLIIDDGSTDNSRLVLEAYQDQRPRISIIFQENKGLNVSNNIALHLASGKYLIRLDADDYLDPNALQVMASTLESNPEIGLVFPDYYRVDEDDNVIDMVRRHDFREVSLLDQPAHGAGTMIHTALLREMGGYDESFRCQDGYDLWVRFIKRHNVMNINIPLFYYRQHPDSLSQNPGTLLDTRASILARPRKVSEKVSRATAIVACRGIDVPGENPPLRPLGKRPLIEWTLDLLLEADSVSDILVTTPDKKLLDHISRRYKSRILGILRPHEMGSLNTHIETALLHALESAEETIDLEESIMSLGIESPFRTVNAVNMAIDLMDTFDVDSVISVLPEADEFYSHNGHGLVPLRSNRRLRLERDDIFRETNSVRVTKLRYLRDNRKLVGGKIGHVVVDQKSALTLRTEWDWRYAQFLAEQEIIN